MKGRFCSRCSTTKASTEFYHWPKKERQWSRWCRPCTRAYWREWYKDNENAQRHYNRQKQKRYHMKPEHRARVLARRKKRRRENPRYREKEIEQSHRARLKRRGLTESQYKKLFDEQNGFCAICRQPEISIRMGRIRNLAIDHNHTTDKVRGLLCNRCNRGLGYFLDRSALLEAAVSYLKLENL